MKNLLLFLFTVIGRDVRAFNIYANGIRKIFIFLTALFFSAAVFAAERQVTLRIEEMNCQLCVYLVNKELRAVDGVLSTKANFNDRLVNVVADEKVSDEQLISAIDKLHYHAVVQK